MVKPPWAAFRPVMWRGPRWHRDRRMPGTQARTFDAPLCVLSCLLGRQVPTKMPWLPGSMIMEPAERAEHDKREGGPPPLPPRASSPYPRSE